MLACVQAFYILAMEHKLSEHPGALQMQILTNLQNDNGL